MLNINMIYKVICKSLRPPDQNRCQGFICAQTKCNIKINNNAVSCDFYVWSTWSRRATKPVFYLFYLCLVLLYFLNVYLHVF